MRGPRRGTYPVGTDEGVTDAAGRGKTDGLSCTNVAGAGLFLGRRRFGIFCRSSHTRSVSSEIATPTFASDCAINRIDAPARRSASSTSRYGSNSANRRERGLRPAAINWASVAASRGALSGATVGAAGQCVSLARETSGKARSRSSGTSGGTWAVAGEAPGEVGPRMSCSPATAGVSMCCIPAIYRAPVGRAMGTLWVGSKPRGLDVGVLAHGFLWEIRDGFTSLKRMLPWSEIVLACFEEISFGPGKLAQWLSCGSVGFVGSLVWVVWKVWVMRCSVTRSLSSLDVGGGGGGSW